MPKTEATVRRLPVAGNPPVAMRSENVLTLGVPGRDAPAVPWISDLDGAGNGKPRLDGSDTSADGGDERLLQVGDIAKATGKTVRAIHHYEEMGLLTPHARSKGRYRLYDQNALTRVRWIGKLHDLGLSLTESSRW
jgi:hypothetical protein